MVEYARKEFEPIRKVLSDLSGGVDFGKPASKLQENAFSDVLNLEFFRGIIRVDSGYSMYRQPVLGIPQAAFQFVQDNGALQTVLLTTSTLYLDNGVEWQWVSDGIINTVLAAETDAPSNTFVFGSAAGLAVGASVGISLNDGSQLRTTITAIAANNVTTFNPVPAGKKALNGAVVVRPPIFNGSIQFQPTEVPWPLLNSLIFTNGVDPIQIWNGSTCMPLPGWNNITARALTSFHGFLIAGDTTEGGTRFPQRLRWSDADNPETITTGLAGLVDLADTEDFVLSLISLGPWLIIYRQNSVMRRSFIGDPLELFFDEYMLQGLGVWSQNAIADTGATHVFSGPAGIFRYSGGYDAEDVGEAVFDQIFGPQGIVNESALQLSVLFYVEETDEVWMLLATGANTTNLDTMFRLDQGSNAWWVRKFANPLIGFGFIESLAGRSWQQANITWQQDTTTWLSHSKTPSAPLIILCDPVAMQTYLYDFASPTDNGSAIKWSVTTKDFESPEQKLRFDGVYVKGIGNGVLTEISFDRGQTFQILGTMNFGGAFSQQQVNAQFVCDSFRLRFSGSDPRFQIDWYRCDYYPETPW